MQEFAKILSNVEIAKDIWKMELKTDLAKIAKPGQFIEITVPGFYLRRPISISEIKEDILVIIYKVLGEGGFVALRKIFACKCNHSMAFRLRDAVRHPFHHLIIYNRTYCAICPAVLQPYIRSSWQQLHSYRRASGQGSGKQSSIWNRKYRIWGERGRFRHTAGSCRC